MIPEAELKNISEQTIEHYNAAAHEFWLGTKDHDVAQNRSALLRHIHGDGPHRILDVGCGPGRDVMAFASLGHHPTGLDGAAQFIDMISNKTNCPVLHQDFLNLSLPDAHFQGVFANASLFHIPRQELPRVLMDLRRTLVDGGVLFSSNPRGPDVEGWNGQRYGTFLTWDTWRKTMTGAGFQYCEHYYRPTGKPREEQPWLASVWRKV